MALDGIVIGALSKDLKRELLNKKIYKIYQIANTEVVLHFKDIKLFISASSGGPSIFMTGDNFDNPKKPPLFSMVLRKHIGGAIIEDIYQYGNDRLIRIDMQAKDEFFQIRRKSLIIELMGRHSNLILLDEDDKIIDSITKVSPSMSRVRTVLPGEDYIYLEDVTKRQPLELEKSQIYDILNSIEESKSVANVIFQSFTGFSKQIGFEISHRAGINPDAGFDELSTRDIDKLADEIYRLAQDINNSTYSPCIYYEGDRQLDFHVVKLHSLEGSDVKTFATANDMIRDIFSSKREDDSFSQKRNSILKSVNKILKRDQNKVARQIQEYNEAKDRDKYKLWADLLAANYHRIQPGMESIELENFYSENLEKIDVPLDVRYSGPDNAQHYYKTYSSLKNAQNVLQGQIEDTQTEISYMESVKSSLSLAESSEDLDLIKDELIQEGYIRRNKGQKKKSKDFQSEFIEYKFKDATILVGRNNRENSLLTFKSASKDDLWLHIQGLPGSHVIIKNPTNFYDEETINYAANLAAYYSSARDSGFVNVDYTPKKNVKRHPSGKPGLVTYSDFDTVYVDSSKVE